MTDFEKKYLDLTKQIVLRHVPLDEYAVFLFGSRADGTNNKYSDIDVGIWGESELSSKILSQIMDELEMSDVPFDCDVIDFSKTKEDFRSFALKKIQLWNFPKNLEKNFRILSEHAFA